MKLVFVPYYDTDNTGTTPPEVCVEKSKYEECIKIKLSSPDRTIEISAEDWRVITQADLACP